MIGCVQADLCTIQMNCNRCDIFIASLFTYLSLVVYRQINLDINGNISDLVLITISP